MADASAHEGTLTARGGRGGGTQPRAAAAGPGTPEAWLAASAPGFADLHAGDRQAISEFTRLWSLLEARLLDTHGSAHATAEAVRTMSPSEDDMADDRFTTALAHFGARYFEDGRPTAAHAGLRLRASDGAHVLEAVLAHGSRDPVEVVAALLLVCHRYRNNLLHGAKWAYGLRGQRDNFERANSVLMATMDIQAARCELHGETPPDRFSPVPQRAVGVPRDTATVR
jgi:hypothetical protein